MELFNSTPLPSAVHYKLLIALDYIYKESYIIPRLSAMYTDRHCYSLLDFCLWLAVAIWR